MAFTDANMDHLTRSEVWSSQLKEVLEDTLQGMQYVDWLTEFPDGDTFTIPSIGQSHVDDYTEDQAVKYRAMDTGEFQFTINEYKSSATYITRKQMQDSYYMSKLVSMFVPGHNRAIMEDLEENIFALQSKQTLSDPNTINGADHRFVASGPNETMSLKDFAKAKYALKKANVPMTDLVAIVDPSVEFAFDTITNLTNVSNNPRWEGIVESGIASGMKFIRNIYGFDVYTSNFLDDANETIGGVTTSSGKANLFFSASRDVLPFVGAWRQMPMVDSEFNKDYQREEYVTTARYGLDLLRPENFVVALSDDDQVN